MFKKWINRSVLQKWTPKIRAQLASMTDDELTEAQACLDELQRILEQEQTVRYAGVH